MPMKSYLHTMNKFALFTGETVDYGYAPSKIYNYTFHAGSTCASPDASIKITDDMVAKEGVESFYIRIMPYTLPFGVIPYGQATILINDNDSKFNYI